VRTLVAVTLAAVALGSMVGCGYPPATDETWITLNQAGDSCRPDDVGMLVQKRGQGVRWHVVNNCTNVYSVKVDNFRLRDRQNGNRPANTPTALLGDNPSNTASSVSGRGGTATIAGTLRGDATPGVYKYDVSTSTDGGKSWNPVLDPDVEPWP
jgi:hypothetical protein